MAVIAPSANLGGWVKVQNGVPVIINDFEAAMHLTSTMSTLTLVVQQPTTKSRLLK